MARRGKRRNLMKRGDTWYVEVIVDGRRIKRSLKTGVLEEAIERRDPALRDAIAERERAAIAERERAAAPEPESMPTFSEMARKTLKSLREEIEHGEDDAYARTTVRRWELALREGGPVLSFLGPERIDAIDGPKLRAWWDDVIVKQRRRGKNERDAIGAVFTCARDGGLLPESHDPVTQLGRQLAKRRRRRGAKVAKIERGRLAKEGRLSAEDFGRLTKSAREDRHPQASILIMLAGECGLRRGELVGLRYEDLVGAGQDDSRRHLCVRHSRSSGGPLGPVKSGKARRVPCSRRLWRALEEDRSRRKAGGPCVIDLAGKPVGAELAEPSPYVLSMSYYDLDGRYLARICKAAGIERRTFQNLRATCSSLLKEWGIPEKLVRAAIGHAGDAVAEAHYDDLDPTQARPVATWDPEAGENFADLFARLCPEPKSHQKSHHHERVAIKALARRVVRWRSQRESNPCLSLERAPS